MTTNLMRLAAILVLVTSVLDYWAYDRFDPTAPMNACGRDALSGLLFDAVPVVSLESPNLPDDHCLGCSPLLRPRAPSVPLAGLFSSVNDSVYRCAKLNRIETSAPIASRDPTGFERPMQV